MSGANLFQSARYEQAKEQFERVRLAASTPPDLYIEARAITNIGGCWFALHRYNLALKSFLAAKDMAERTGDSSAAAGIEANLASLYSEMGEQDAAVGWLQKSLSAWEGKERLRHLPQLEFEMAALRARQGRMEEAAQLFQSGTDAASRAGNTPLVAVGCNKFGEELLRAGRIRDAERPLLQAYYLRKLNRLPLEGSYTNLGRLRLAQGDPESASVFLDRGLELAQRSAAAMPTWDAYLARGQVHLAQRRYRDALADMRIAVRLARAWRWSLPADDASHIGAEGILDGIYSGLVEAANRLYFETRNPELIRESFEASEENRAMSLRMLVRGRQEDASELPPAYWEAVARLQHAEISSLRGGEQDALNAARADWIRIEASVASDLAPPPPGSLDKLRASLSPGTVLLSIRLGASISWIWAVDREGAAVYELPPRSEVQAVAGDARRAVGENRVDSDAPGQLYKMLFGTLSPRFRAKQRWVLALDPDLLEIPIAALPIEAGARPVYVAERHVIQIIPGAGYWLDSARSRIRLEVAGPFLGVGDPIYNLADSRLPQSPTPGRPRVSRWSLFADTRPPDPGLALPRLVASGKEVERCARTWKGESILLRGRDASASSVREALNRNPAVIHFSVHFLESSLPHAHGLMALGLGTGNQPELIAPVEISHWRTNGGLVVLSGCGSGSGEALPGTGLMGLTRAWLTAGARSVLASRWTTADEDSGFFEAFYREYGVRGTDAAAALTRAQAEMIRKGGWRAQPSYWGAWFVVGN